MTTSSLAKINRVDLRQAWPNEAQDFTPWLAENIAELGEALGMDLELQQTEAPVGGYSLDILATDLNQNRPVIIENQLEPTNHTHLGQLLTYAAGYDANVIVWLTREFRDEHRQALDWLNQRTDENTQFFGVVVELWQIAGSPLAPHFNVVASPSDWSKRVAASLRINASAKNSGNAEMYRDFFQGLVDILRDNHKFTNHLKVHPYTRNWWEFRSGYTGFIYRASLSRKQAGVKVYVDHQLFEDLAKSEVEITAEFSENLDWKLLKDNKHSQIELLWAGEIQENSDTFAEIQGWMVKNLLKFQQVFSPYLAQLAT